MITTINNEHKELNFSSEREQSQTCLNSAEHEKNQGRKVLNVPNLRFKEFQGEWEKKRLEECVEFLDGLRKPIKSEDRKSEQGLYPYYGASGIIDYIDGYIFDGEYILLSEDGANIIDRNYRVAFIAKGKIWVNNHAHVLQPYDGFDINFLSETLERLNYAVYNTGTTMPKLNQEVCRNINLKIPTTKEQNKIGNLLSLLNKRIATQNKIIDKLQSLIKGLNDFLYTQYGGEVLTSFAELGTSYSGLSGKSAQDFGSGKPFITYLNVYSNNVVNENDFQYVAIKDGEKQNVAEYGDVLFTLSSETPEEVGIGSVYLGKENVYLNSFCFGIHITNAKIAFPPYLSYYVSSTPFRKFVYPYAQGSTRFNLCKADFEKASIKLPSLESQKQIYSILKSIASKIETEKKLRGLYYTQKQYLLRQMFI